MKRLLSAFLAVSTIALAEPFTTTQTVTVYDVANPKKGLGQFLAGTHLDVSPKEGPPGFYQVTFTGPNGAINGLVHAEDIGKSTATPAPRASPQFGQSSVFRTVAGSLVNAAGSKVSSEKLGASKYVLVYFSAHWCPPCRKFTPELVEFYKANRAKDFEVVFVSNDHSVADMKTYMSELGMPWPGIEFGSQAQAYLERQFAGRGIPDLVMLDETGKVVSDSYSGQTYLGPHKVLKDLQAKW